MGGTAVGQRTLVAISVGAALAVVLGVLAAVLIIRSKQQVVVVAPVARATFGNPPIRLSARASSGLPVTFAVRSGPCAVAGDMVTIKGAGRCVVRASQNGTDGWHVPASATASITIDRANQSITFGDLPGKTHGDAPFDVQASASSGLPVVFSGAGACTLAGATVTIAMAGDCTVTASQEGSANYLPAPAATRDFTVAPLRLPNGKVLVDNGSRNGLGQLTIQNGQDVDAVAVLTTSDNTTVFSVSIQAQQTYEIDSIRDGTYNLFFEIGNDWNDSAGTFNLDGSRERFDDPFSFQTTPVAGGLQYQTYTVTLQPVAGGTASTSSVGADQFPPVH
jgi:hypothetical protein